MPGDHTTASWNLWWRGAVANDRNAVENGSPFAEDILRLYLGMLS
jgi:hypothetical protein